MIKMFQIFLQTVNEWIYGESNKRYTDEYGYNGN